MAIIKYGDERQEIPSFLLILRKYGPARFSVPYSDPQKIEWALKKMPALKSSTFTKIPSSLGQGLMEKIREFEIKATTRNFKFGVLYSLAQQTSEEQFYTNKDFSSRFEDFLNTLGTVIELKGHKGFKG